jgi:hypothetical protein
MVPVSAPVDVLAVMDCAADTLDARNNLPASRCKILPALTVSTVSVRSAIADML